ncbi:hypothetical protein BN173_810024 [Clostridioides difficile T11]|nr:hypothetical protein BN173_810024 [Clostridioides difficile T11]CCL40311.1 hypothetical protein BN176_840028 [Clostridioides difficile E19]
MIPHDYVHGRGREHGHVDVHDIYLHEYVRGSGHGHDVHDDILQSLYQKSLVIPPVILY